MNNKKMMIIGIVVVIFCCCISISIGVGVFMYQMNTGYTFHPQLDSGGSDYLTRSDLANKIDELKKLCDSDTKCVAFNSNGYLKSGLQPSNSWYKWTDDKTKGLYVKASN